MTSPAPIPTRPSFRPLLKWPGGKTREWKEIAPHLPPSIRHYVDPFVGGGAPFGLTPFSGRAFLNDRHERLIELYRRVQRRDAGLARELRGLAGDWDALSGVSARLDDAFSSAVDAARRGEAVDASAVTRVVQTWSRETPLVRCGVEGRTAAEFLIHSMVDKARRVARLEQRHAVHFDDDALATHRETAVRAGYYTLIRAHERESGDAARVADFVFVREFCYGSMFRTNAKGEFNIPYGGASYNGKSFSTRAEQLISEAAAGSLSGAEFSCGDFEPFLDALDGSLGADDFVFLDPPYHSDFSTYGRNAFDLDDHRRLAAALARLPTRWLQVIKETPEVRALYETADMRAAGVHVAAVFGKQYGYNVRGRNVRDARHLVIRNY